MQKLRANLEVAIIKSRFLKNGTRVLPHPSINDLAIYWAKYSSMDEVKVLEDSLEKFEVIWSIYIDHITSSFETTFLLDPFLNIVFHILKWTWK